MKLSCIQLLLLLTLASIKAGATVRAHSLFSNHMVLQKGKPITVWGTATSNEKVTVAYYNQSVSTDAHDGKWMVTLKPLPYILTGTDLVITASNTIVISDVVVGEVWLCSGQSNMERQLGPRPPQPLINNWQNERDSARYPLIREYYVPLKYASEKIEDINGSWTVCAPETVSEFSAVGYLFSKELHKKLHVPVGILFSAFGGTPAEDWTSKEALTANQQLAGIVTNYNKPSTGYRPAGKTMCGLYNGMIYPLIPFSIKGVAWYQGEANNEQPETYADILENMINNWRTDFKQGTFPFLIVQIAPHKEMRPETREAQLIVSKKVEKTALIVTTDCGDSNEIHPPDKQTVGKRLSLAARHLAYGEKLEYSGPLYQGYSITGNKIVVSFSHAKGLKPAWGSELQGFTVAAADGRFVTANAQIVGTKIKVYSPQISNPAYVRYGWSNVPLTNLVNSANLPASPFRTGK